MKSPGKRFARNWIVAGLLLAPVLYVLSIGPVARWANSVGDPEAIPRVVMVVYAPAMSMMEMLIVGPILDWYCELWTDTQFVWSEICDFAADQPALQDLGVRTSVGVGHVLVGGTPP